MNFLQGLKAKGPGGHVTLAEVDDWLRRIPIFQAHLKKHHSLSQATVSFELWTSGAFHADALCRLEEERRRRTKSQISWKIDVALWNDGHPDGLFFLPNIILVECKNWSQAVGSGEVNWFDSKLRNRGLNFGVLVATNGITGNAEDLTAAHAVVAAALREGRRLVVLRTQEIVLLGDSVELVLLIKEKLCELAVRGTVV